MNFGNSKEERQINAKNHMIEMSKKYAEQIKYSIDKSYIQDREYDYSYLGDTKEGSTCKLVNADTVSVLFKAYSKYGTTSKYGVLNFASYKYPGGGFIKGSKAQEECLCHESTLYNVLKEFDSTFYRYNRSRTYYGLYSNRSIYTPNIIFERDDIPMSANVISIAAPNIAAIKRSNRPVSDKYIKEAIDGRILTIIYLANKFNIETLVLGAFGCGVFNNDPEYIAKSFMKQIKQYSNTKNIIFAIPYSNHNKSNFLAFDSVLEEYYYR